METKRVFIVVLGILGMLLGGAALVAQDEPVLVRLQLRDAHRAQFAGYYAADVLGYYESEGLDIRILPGGAGIDPQQVVADGEAEFGVDWLSSVLQARQDGRSPVNIAQIFQSSGMRQIAWADSGLETVGSLRGAAVGVGRSGSRLASEAVLKRSGIEPGRDVTVRESDFTIEDFLDRRVAVAHVMSYDELALVLEVTGADGTFPVHEADDLTLLDFNALGVTVLEDGIFADAAWLAQPGNEALAVRFLRATFRGWAHCRQHPADCVQWSLEERRGRDSGHQEWMMTAVNQLVWPSPDGIGIMDQALFDQTVEIAREVGALRARPERGAFRIDLAQRALQSLDSDFPQADFTGKDWQPPTVAILPDGEER